MNNIFKKLTYFIQVKAATSIVAALAIILFSTAAAAGAKQSDDYTIVIDAGHGGKDHGAIDNGKREKDINLGVAKKLAAHIKKNMKNVKVVMTRDDDTFISLQERANIANRNQGDLFISIHTNSVDKSNPNRAKISGTSVYALGPQKDADNLRVAQRENGVIEFEDEYNTTYSGFDASRDESYIIFEMAQKKTLAESLKFADKAQKELVNTAGRVDRGVKQAGFLVLWATSMPAVLVELDFICNPDEAEYLGSSEGQEELATALFNAVDNYVTGAETKARNASVVKNNIKENKAQNTKKTSDNKKQTNSGKTKQTASTAPKAENNTTSVATESQQSNDTSEGGSLMASNSENKKEREHIASAQPSKSYGPRRRRSAKSKQMSDNRDVETASIELSQENIYLVKNDTSKEDVKTETLTASNDNQKDKSKKQKNKKTKKEKKTEKPDSKNKAVAQNTTKKNGRTTIYVNTPENNSVSASNVSKTNPKKEESVTSETKIKRPANPMPPTGGEMVYKILLATSDTEMSLNAPEFYGLAPIEVYKENNQYKYTYASSKSRQEIEKKLLELKSFIPEATIVVRSE